MEIRKIVRTYSVDKCCDECKVGFMRPTGVVLTSSPPWYPHICNGCGYKENYRKSYPHFEYVE